MSRALAAATRQLIAAAMTARTKIGPGNVDLGVELSAAIGAADEALREHEAQEMLDERNRRQVRELSRTLRKDAR